MKKNTLKKQKCQKNSTKKANKKLKAKKEIREINKNN